MIMMTGTRPRMFRDAIEQYALTAPGLTILVGDFGAAETQRQNAAAAALYPETIRYHAFEPQTPWRERFRRLLDLCETPYVVPAADDDFLLPDGLRESVTFLRAHPDYAACHGIYYFVAPTQEPGRLGIGISCGFTGRAYESNDPVGRLMALMYWYQSVWYAVQRRDDLRRVEVPDAVKSGAMTELFTAAAAVIAGKVARLRSPYCMRNPIPADATATPVEFSDLIMLGGEGFLEEYVPVRDGLVALLRAGVGADRNWARLVDIAFASHVRKNWREGAVWSKLADQGEIPREDLAVLSAPGIESEAIPIPGDYLARFIGPLAAHGWPNFG